jgi:hypothetical protein
VFLKLRLHCHDIGWQPHVLQEHAPLLGPNAGKLQSERQLTAQSESRSGYLFNRAVEVEAARLQLSADCIDDAARHLVLDLMPDADEKAQVFLRRLIERARLTVLI